MSVVEREAGQSTGQTENIAAVMREIGIAAKAALGALATSSAEARNNALNAAATAIRAGTSKILDANQLDLAYAQEKGIRASMIDRLVLDEGRIEAIAKGLEDIAALPESVGQVIDEWTRPNGLTIQRVRVPLGVIGIIYESRPNVTADAGGLCLKSGNAAILRGGSESFHSSSAIADYLHHGLRVAGLPEAAVQLIPTRDRDAVGELLRMVEFVDVIVPRGGKSLIERVQTDSRVPVFAHLEGLCHVYLDHDADPNMARDIAVNAKMRRTSVCGAAETLLVDKTAAEHLLPQVAKALIDAGCELRGDEGAVALVPSMTPATAADWTTEYLDAILSVRLVDGVEGAIQHIEEYGSHHTETIVTSNQATAETFLAKVDSAILLHNASTQYADGGEFGMGAEIGISTGRLHARGPVGAEQLTSFKYVVRGSGQIRP
ncbi:MAG: glutamate-5-semialdehyde dehydrogenase [Rhodospirillaceae bacterium]|nr:glutamate-5-semialdehyde dehydrogenase [Rhodospirillaceae bacterium]